MSSPSAGRSPAHRVRRSGHLRTLLIGIGLMLLSASAFASTPAFVRLAAAAHVRDLSLVAFRCLLGAAVLWLLGQWRRVPQISGVATLRLAALGALLFAPQMWFYFAALDHMGTAVTVAVVYTYPAIVLALVSLRLRLRPQLRDVGLIGVALLGVLAAAALDGRAPVSVAGICLAGLTAGIYALYVVLAAGAARGLPAVRSASAVLAGAGVSSVAVAPLFGGLALPSSAAGWGYVALHGLVIVPIGLGAYYLGLDRLGATRASIVDTTQPAIAALIGIAALHEYLDQVQVIGISLIMLSVMGLAISAGSGRRPAAEDRTSSPEGMNTDTA